MSFTNVCAALGERPPLISPLPCERGGKAAMLARERGQDCRLYPKKGLRWLCGLGYLRDCGSAIPAVTIDRQEIGMARPLLFFPCLTFGFRRHQVDLGARSLLRRAAVCIALVCLPLVFPGRVLAADLSVSEIDRLITDGDLNAAAEVARQIDSSEPTSFDPTLVLARLAHAFQQAGKVQEAAEFYGRSITASGRPAAQSLSPDKMALVRLAAASVLIQTGQINDALDALVPTFAAGGGVADSHRQMATKLALRTGSAALTSADYKLAFRAYTLALDHASPQEKPVAMLGAAWAIALAGEQPVEAAKQLAAFIHAYPDHTDAARAARACAECLKQAGRDDDANAMLADLLSRWPTSEAAIQVVLNQPAASDSATMAPAVRQWLLTPAATQRIESLNAKTLQSALVVAMGNEAADFFDTYARQLARIDKSGQTTADTLQQLADSERPADAERMATLLVSPPEGLENEIVPAAREAACRWAGRTQRWSMLALASETESTDSSPPSRTVSVERLFAEALMQTGRTADAHRWWNHLVDVRGAIDFATLLRCAETETSLGKDASLAAKRIAAARQAAGDDVFQLSLVHLLEAELAIRQIQFDQARGHLESVIRSTETDAGLRGRAQWLIGETYYLQQKFAQAIEAYRRVEGMDRDGLFVAASLVQAGKSFEQLGRTREAAVCYWGLLNRFAESPHAAMARRRLAAIAPEQGPQNNQSRPILRR